MRKNLLVLALLTVALTACSNIKLPNTAQNSAEKSETAANDAIANGQTLKERLDAYAELAKQRIPASTKQVMISATENLRKSSMSRKFLKVGDRAPNFELDSLDGKEYELYDMLENGPVIVSFYRGGWCPYCNIELKALNERYSEFKRKGAQLVAISPEMPNQEGLTQKRNGLSFPLLYDRSTRVADKYHLSFKLDERLRPIYKGFGIDLEKFYGNNDYELPVPATYVVGKDKIIKYAFADVDYKNRAEPDAILKAI